MLTTSTAPTGTRRMVWHLEAEGWSEREAGNLVALARGLRPARNGWTVREIEHLRFLHEMVKTGRIVR